jgi:hypothetical protein
MSGAMTRVNERSPTQAPGRPVSASAMTTRQPSGVVGLNANGVGVLSPVEPEFYEVARPLLGERIADVGLRLKPTWRLSRTKTPRQW